MELCLLQRGHSCSHSIFFLNKWLHEKLRQPDSSLLVCFQSRLKSQLWYIILNVMHVLRLRSAQCLCCLACMFYGHTVHYGCAGTAHAELKKEMGLRHVSGDYNHRKQEHNCLEYTDSRKCTSREGQEDWERKGEMDGAEDEGEIFVTEASKVEMETKTRQGHFFLHILSSSYSIY